MRGFWTIYRRELAALFLMPLAWVLLCVAWPLTGVLFVSLLESARGDLNTVFRFLLSDSIVHWSFLVLFPPLLTMRMISEEARSGVLEYVLTAPVSDAAVVSAKLAAATTFMVLFWSAFLVYGLAVQVSGTTPDWGLVAVQFVGCCVLSALFSAIGLMASAVTQTPLIAAVMAIIVSLSLLALPLFGNLTRLAPDHWVFRAIDEVSVVRRWYGSFGAGVLDSAHALFFLVLTAVTLFGAIRLVESRRWR